MLTAIIALSIAVNLGPVVGAYWWFWHTTAPSQLGHEVVVATEG